MKQEVQVILRLEVSAEKSKENLESYFRQIHSNRKEFGEILSINIKEEAEIYQVEQDDDYCVICWPDIQELMDKEGFDDNSCLINDGILYEKYGDSSYFVNKNWIKHLTK